MAQNTSLLGMSKCQTILIIEDSPEDFEFTTRALKQVGYVGGWHHVKNGEEALDYLNHIDSSQKTGDLLNFPSLILLDLNMPKVPGIEVLKMLKEHEDFCKIPVIVISTSDSSQDIDDCYRLGANSYIHKSIDYSEFRETIGHLKSYWLETVLMPNPLMNKTEKFVQAKLIG